MKLSALEKLTETFDATNSMPVLFVGHGSPMNAIADNDYGRSWQQLGKSLTRPKAILCISAHWQTKGTFVTAAEKPKTIHDFYGFPKPLFDVQYPAPGSAELAKVTQACVTSTPVGLDYDWGLDHGSWSVLKHIYPEADIPVLEMSLDYTQSPVWHLKLAKELKTLRNRGVLIIGSGNMVHNLREIDMNKTGGFDWATEASAVMKKLIAERDFIALADYNKLGTAVQLAIPTPEHYLPMLYALGLAEKNENISLFNDQAEMGSLTMTSLKIDSN